MLGLVTGRLFRVLRVFVVWGHWGQGGRQREGEGVKSVM